MKKRITTIVIALCTVVANSVMAETIISMKSSPLPIGGKLSNEMT